MNTIPALTREANLKRRLRNHLKKLGFTKADDGALVLPGNGKEAIRSLHCAQRKERIAKSRAFIAERLPKLIESFAVGSDINPASIKPVLQRVRSNTLESDLFRMAALTWTVPVSSGFGRRLRYLVWDESNDKLMGIIAIGDPVFNLSVRDKLIGWNSEQRGQRLANSPHIKNRSGHSRSKQ